MDPGLNIRKSICTYSAYHLSCIPEPAATSDQRIPGWKHSPSDHGSYQWPTSDHGKLRAKRRSNNRPHDTRWCVYGGPTNVARTTVDTSRTHDASIRDVFRAHRGGRCKEDWDGEMCTFAEWTVWSRRKRTKKRWRRYIYFCLDYFLVNKTFAVLNLFVSNSLAFAISFH